jgi:hypothetical protein
VEKSKTVDDIEAGMFIRFQGSTFICLDILGFGYIFVCPLGWSYTYDGEYSPFVNEETEEQKKIRELEEIINKAEQQIQELRGVIKPSGITSIKFGGTSECSI